MTEIINWAPLSISYKSTVTGVEIVLTTDIPTHLWIRYTNVKPLTHKEPLLRRGVALPNATRFCFVAFHELEQSDPSDTLTHTFTLEPWAVCETRYFLFHWHRGRRGVPLGQPDISLSPD